MKSMHLVLAALALLLAGVAPPSRSEGAADGKGADAPKSPQSFIWSVTGLPPAVRIDGAVALPVNVSVGPVAADGVRLVPTTLTEQSRLAPLAPLSLCRTKGKPCDGAIPAIPASSTASLWLHLDDEHPRPGKYIGNVIIASNEKPQGDSIAMTIYATNGWAQALGVLAIVLGVAGGWLVTTFAHSRFNRDQMLMPARLLAERAQHLLELVRQGNAAAPASGIEDQLVQLLNLLDPESLEQADLIPPAVPAPWANPAAQSGSAQAFYQKTGDVLGVFGVAITEGLQVIWSSMPASATQAPTPDVARRLVGQLQAILQPIDCSSVSALNAVAVPAVALVAQQVATQVTAWQDAFVPAGTAMTARLLRGAGSRTDESSSPHRISMQIRNLSGVTWAAVLVLSVVAGSYQLIYLNLGFGIGVDYFLCFFWGLGLPIGAGQLAQMNGGSAAAALQVQLPK